MTHFVNSNFKKLKKKDFVRFLNIKDSEGGSCFENAYLRF